MTDPRYIPLTTDTIIEIPNDADYVEMALFAGLHEGYKVLKAENERLRAALEAVEWVDDGENYGWCPWCDATPHGGHKPDCQRQIALGKATP